MALIQCGECKGQVSDQASACPHCGAPLVSAATAVAPAEVPVTPVKRIGAKWEGIGTAMIIGSLLGFAVHPIVGGMMSAIGFVVFIVGRFL